nr:C6 zinc finger domain protein [Colletotrichum truncatum]KAF6787935.1 C6 zinc finger domain protein [Colletotrichum truncatum]
MSLGPQCWRCRKKRLRCDSSVPNCRKCTAADVDCPGYGDKRPIAWRNPLVLTDKGIVRVRENGAHDKPASASVMGIICRSPRTVGSELELRMTADAIEYYNMRVAPDLVPYATQQSPYQIAPSAVGELAEYVRKSYISISALHRFVSREPGTTSSLSSDGSVSSLSVVRSRARGNPAATDPSDLAELMGAGDFQSVHFAAQAAALRALSEELHKHQANEAAAAAAGADTLHGIMLMLSSQIQYSAYAPWQAHIHGAWGLIAAQGGMEVLARMDKDLCRVFQQIAVVDIFGMSTHHLTETSARTILSRHASYAMIFDASAIDILNPWTLMPNGLAKALSQINMLRAQNTLAPSAASRHEGLSAVLSALDTASPDSWAKEVATNATVWVAPGQLSEDAESKAAWRALMTAFLNATVLYAINGLAGLGGTHLRVAASSQEWTTSLTGREMTAYHALLASVRFLFDQRTQRRDQRKDETTSDPAATSAGLLHKFVIWPMVIGGIQAALVHRDEEAAAYLCAGMQSIGEELGTVSMIDGARLVEKLQQSYKNGNEPRSWDDLFDGAPLFLM